MRAAATIIACLFVMSLVIIRTAWQHGKREAESEIRSKHGPDVSHCFEEEETRELWDCIRHED